ESKGSDVGGHPHLSLGLILDVLSATLVLDGDLDVAIHSFEGNVDRSIGEYLRVAGCRGIQLRSNSSGKVRRQSITADRGNACLDKSLLFDAGQPCPLMDGLLFLELIDSFLLVIEDLLQALPGFELRFELGDIRLGGLGEHESGLYFLSTQLERLK